MSSSQTQSAPSAAHVAVRIGAAHIAAPVDAVRQAVPIAAAAAILPRRAGAIHSVIRYRDSVVPVIDLGRWVTLGEGSEMGEVGDAPQRKRALILQSAARSIAVAVDEIEGVVDLPPDTIHRLCHDDAPEEVFSCVATPRNSETILSVLDVERLMQLSATWSATAGLDEDHHGTDAAQATAAGDTRRVKVAVAAVHGFRIGIDAGDIGEVRAMPPLDTLGASSTVALCRWRGRHVPVIDLAHTFSEPGRPGARALLAVLERDGRALGIALDEVRRIQDLDLASGNASLLAQLHPAILGVSNDEDAAPIRILDTAALMAMYPETGISLVESTQQGAGARTGQANPGAYVVFQAGTPLAAPIEGIEEVLSSPTELTTRATSAGHIASFAWRERQVDVLDLRSGPSEAAAGKLLVARIDGQPRAFLVDAIQALVPPNSATMMRVSLAGSAPFDMITTGQGDEQASYRVINLRALWPQLN